MSNATGDPRDRRRSPRVDVGTDERLDLEICATVQVVDISSSGAMVAGPVSVPKGERTALRTSLDGTPMVLWFETRWSRETVGEAAAPARAGGAFVDLDVETQRRLEAFLSRVR